MGVTGVGLVAASGNSDLALLLLIVGSALWCGAMIKATIAAIRAARNISALQE